MAKHKTPLFRDLSNEALLEQYVSLKALAYNGAKMKWPGLGRCLRNLDIVIGLARKRGMSLPAALPSEGAVA